MPLVKKVVETSVPDEEGGWYWYKPPGGNWKPVEVSPKESTGWPATFVLGVHDTDVKDAPGEWGPQIIPPTD